MLIIIRPVGYGYIDLNTVIFFRPQLEAREKNDSLQRALASLQMARAAIANSDAKVKSHAKSAKRAGRMLTITAVILCVALLCSLLALLVFAPSLGWSRFGMFGLGDSANSQWCPDRRHFANSTYAECVIASTTTEVRDLDAHRSL